MAPEAIRTPSGPLETSADLDLLAGLWREAPFARLPPDAPAELQAYIQDIENPSRVYAIHKASRRNDFQLLVERFVEIDTCARSETNCRLRSQIYPSATIRLRATRLHHPDMFQLPKTFGG